MASQELDDWMDEFEAFHARFADLFARREPRAQAIKYMRGLMATVDRKNAWQVAEALLIGSQTQHNVFCIGRIGMWTPPATFSSCSLSRRLVTRKRLA